MFGQSGPPECGQRGEAPGAPVQRNNLDWATPGSLELSGHLVGACLHTRFIDTGRTRYTQHSTQGCQACIITERKAS